MNRKRLIFWILMAVLSTSRYTCSTTNTTTPPANSLTIINNFGSPVLVEVWSGSNLKYDLGNIKGDNAKKEQVVTAISNVSPNNTLNVIPSVSNTDLLLVFGTDQGANGYIYLTDYLITGYSGTGTASIEANGDVLFQ